MKTSDLVHRQAGLQVRRPPQCQSDSEALFRNIAEHIAEKEGYEKNSITCLTAVEFENYIDNKTLPDENSLKERYESSLIYASINEPHETIILGNEVSECESIILGEVKTKNTLRGIVAFPGVATGKCRIIVDPHADNEFNEGDILVTGMTRPEFIPYIQKSSAIITDVGGMLCHAAVTARELKKPCIVGTNQATKILKNGDVASIDANKGIITIIN